MHHTTVVKKPLKRLLFLLLPLCLGCGDDDVTISPPDGSSGPAADQGVQMELSPDIGIGEEKRLCQYYVMPDDTRYIERIEHSGGPSLHHLALYETFLTPGAVASQLGEAFDCTAGLALANVNGVIYAATTSELSVDFPPDTGLEIKRGLVVLLEHHALHTGSQPAEPLRVSLWYAPQAPAYEVRRFFFYNPAIAIPPQGSSTARMRCAVPHDIEIVLGTAHTHLHGVDFRSEVAGNPPTPIMAGSEASDGVPTETFDPPLLVPGGSFIDFECDYDNWTTSPIVEGPDAVFNEMCILAGAYYSRTNLPLDPAATQCQGEGSHVYYEGTKGCMDTFTCAYNVWFNHPDPKSASADVAAGECNQDMCRSASAAKQAMQTCYWNCCGPDACATQDCAECLPCLQATCPDELAACEAATCP
jgi:hypothetical protein